MAIIGKLRTVWSGVAGAPYYTNLYFSGVTDSSSAQLCVDYWENFLTVSNGIFNTALSYTTDPEVILIDDATGTLTGSIGVVPFSNSGAGGGDVLPRTTQGLIQWQTGIVVAGRRLRGRTFLPGMAESLNTAGGVPEAGFVSDMTTRAQALADEASPPHLVVWSRTHGVSSAVLTGTFWGEWASLRSRRD